MKLKYALWATLVWTLLAMAGSAVAIWYITTHPVPGASTDKRAGQLGQGIGTLMTFGYVAIWVPYLMRLSKPRREERRLEEEKAARRRKHLRQRRVDNE